MTQFSRIKLSIGNICLMSAIIPSASFSMPAMTVSSMGGTNFSMWADAMVPMYEENHRLLFTDVQAQGASNDSGIISFGGGYRQQTDQETIYGAYLFGDRVRSSDKEYYDVLGPGVERLTPTWKYRLNAYIPVGDTDNLVEQGWADDMGNYTYVQFSGHEEYDRRAYQYQSLGYGGDISIGYRFANDDRWEVSVTPYVFDRDENNTLLGSNIQLNFFNSDYTTLFLGDGYDNSNHNRVYVGVSFNFGGRDNSNTMNNLMHSPVYRNLDVNTTSDGLPVSNYTEYSGQNELEANDIYFINNSSDEQSSSTIEDGTYEHPYSDITQINDTTDVNAEFRIEQTGETYTSSEDLILVGNQSLAGYTNDYKKLATQNQRPTIQTSNILLDGTNTLDSVAIIGVGEAASGTDPSVGVTVSEGAVATINNVSIGSTNDNENFQYGVLVGIDATASITNSTITGSIPIDGTPYQYSYGVFSSTNSDVTINESTVNAYAYNDSGVGIAVAENNGGQMNIANSTLYGFGDYIGAGFTDSGGTTVISNSTLIGIGSADHPESSAGIGVYLVGAEDVTITDSIIQGTGGAAGFGVFEYAGPGDLTVSDSAITATGSEESIGVYYVSSGGTAYLSGNTIYSSSADPLGIYAPTGGVVEEGNEINLTTT